MPQVHRSLLRLVPLVLPLWLVTLSVAEEPPQAPAKDYIRFEEDATGARLQTGISTFRNAQGVTVDLIGAIHVADHAYYAKLNERFKHYDALLYEMVGGPISKRNSRLAHAAAAESPPVKKAAPSAAAAPAKDSGKILTAERVPELPGFVRSPYTEPHRLVDVKDAAPGSTYICPYTHRPFLVPPDQAKDKDDGKVEERVQALENYLKHSDPHVRNPAPLSNSDETEEDENSEDTASHRLAWLGGLTSMMQSSLELESQLKGVDYYGANFVHADMSLTQFTKLQDERNEGFLALWWRAVKAQAEHPELQSGNQPGLLKILEILRSKDRSTELKRLIGRTFDSMEMLMTGVEGKNGTVIIAERNQVALRVLQEQIALGKKKIGIFYGAAHLNDMQKRLTALGFTKVNHEWLTAWNLPPEPAPLPEAPEESSRAAK